MSEYLEGVLPDGQLAWFEAHLAGCRHCALYLEQMRETIRSLGELREQDIPWRVKEELRTVFLDWKQGAG